MVQKDPLGPGAMAIEWHTQNCIFRKDLGEMVTVGVAISGWFKRCLEGGVGLVMDRLWRQGEGGHMDDPWDLACLAVPFARPDLQEGCSETNCSGQGFYPVSTSYPCLVFVHFPPSHT